MPDFPACFALAPANIFGYHHFDGFSRRLLNADLLVDAAGYFRAELRHFDLGRPNSQSSYSFLPAPLPAGLLQRLQQLLADPGFGALPSYHLPGITDVSCVRLVGRTPAGVHSFELEASPSAHLGGPHATPTEVALLAVGEGFAALVEQLYSQLT